MARGMKASKGSATSDVLFAVTGMSPAVLTETVWALTHENPPIVPHRVFVITTIPGRKRLDDVLFSGGGWESLLSELGTAGIDVNGRLRFGLANDHVRLLSALDGKSDLEDIATAKDSEAAADSIMRALREFTENPETRVIASIAGGRKTMSALLTSCMTLLGRTQDRLCHVLVNPPFDNPRLDPPFLFPAKGVKHKLASVRKTHPSSSVHIELTDIPFVRVRGWYEQEYRQAPPSYMTLVRRVQGMAPEAVNYPFVTIDMDKGVFMLDRKHIKLSPAEFAVFSGVARVLQEGKQLRSWEQIDRHMDRVLKAKGVPPQVVWLHDFLGQQEEHPYNWDESPRKLANSIRGKLRRTDEGVAVADMLMPKLTGASVVPYPASKIRIIELPDVG